MNFVRNMLTRNSRSAPDRAALICGERQLTHGELDLRTNKVANALRGRGYGAGSALSLLISNSLEFAEIFLASHKLGSTVITNNIRYKTRELRHQLSHSRSEVVFFESKFAELLAPLRGEVGVREWICTSSPVPAWALSYDELVDGAASEDPPSVEIAPGDIATILYTSGTTGVAKGVPLTYWGGLYVGILETNADVGLRRDHTTLCAAPLYHIAGHGFTLLMPLIAGGSVVIQPAFDPAETLSLIEKHRIAFSFFVPTMAQAVVRCAAGSGRDLSSFTKLLTSGAALPEPVKRGLVETFPGIEIYENYGSTEALNISRLLPPDISRKQGCAGLPVLTQQVRLVDPAGKPVRAGEVGEVVIRGPAALHGYHNPPADAANVSGVDGWFHTGDLARQDDEGYLYIVGRNKDMIISGGVNIYPKEIEDVILEHPAVADCAVIGVPDSYWGESICACVVAKDKGLTAAQVVEHCVGQLADFKKPRSVVLLDELPRNASGKVLRGALKEMVANDASNR